MNFFKSIIRVTLMTVFAAFISSCNDDTSYADLLNQEDKLVNAFLVDQKVVNEIPADSVFQTGADAPYYCIDGEGQVYMQALVLGDGQKAKDDQEIYFRYMAYNMAYYHDGKFDESFGSGNLNNMAQSPTSFRFKNYNMPTSKAWGVGLQMPMTFLPLNSEVNLVIKSQYGVSENMSYVQPYFFHVRYLKSMI